MARVSIFRKGHLLCVSLCMVVCLLLAEGLAPRKALAHPHIFVDNYLEMVFDPNGLVGVQVRWAFDAMSSSQYITDLDTNGDGKLTAEEWKEQREDIAGFLGEEKFFIYAMVNGKKVTVPVIKDFIATFEKGVLEYTFFAPLVVPKGNATVIVSVYDPTYYTDFQTVDEHIKFTGAPDGLHHSLDDAPELAFYNGQVIPLAERIQF